MTVYELAEEIPATRRKDPIAGWRHEMDMYLADIRALSPHSPEEIYPTLLAISGRLTEIRILIMRNDNRQATAFRTRELDPFMGEIERQFKMWSRHQSVMETEYKLAGKL